MRKIALFTLFISLFSFYSIVFADTANVTMINKSNVYMDIQNVPPYNTYCINSKAEPHPIKISTHLDKVFDYILSPNTPTVVKMNVVNHYASFSYEDGSNQGLGSPVASEIIIITATVQGKNPSFIAIFPYINSEYNNVKNNNLPECSAY
ncbi:MAG: hypothetical protein KIT56_02745 [Gammaproteobacteria bacterium]|nr:hypothetical protein [Gammaproteobacteria bacterium]MCW5582795.1 hypothetical protein [Gammaproteobacteria bacterium]